MSHLTVPSKTEVIGRSCPIEGVTIFLDRAEVKRGIQVVLNAGENEVLVTRLPIVIDEDSVRYGAIHFKFHYMQIFLKNQT